MNLSTVRLLVVMFTLLSLAPAFCEGDPFMGDYEGEFTGEGGSRKPIVAQVICWGRGEYQANLLDEFDKRIPPVAVLKGKADGDTVNLEAGRWKGTIKDKVFTGTDGSGSFRMEHVVRLSPTLGAEPPEGAVVLFDGTDTDAWEHPHVRNWYANLKSVVGGENCVAYLRTYAWIPEEQRVKLLVGSDDGIKIWVNDEPVHTNNVLRPCGRDSDKVHVKLAKGWNEVVLKISQGGGDWGACARFESLLGKKVKGLVIAPEPSKNLAKEQDFILDWQVAGPYAEPGAGPEKLLDIPFAPEKDKADAEWKTLSLRGPVDKSCRWRLVDGGAMEVFSGSIVSKQAFTDHKIHLEFRTPFMPKERGQGRGNSGVYIQGRYEIQVLDSYGLEGEWNECGGIYKVAKPLVNMCAPPLQWQTYDVTFRAARVDENGEVLEQPRITVIHNGVVIHDDLKLKTTPGGVNYDLKKAGGLYLQDHGDPVRYRNIWVKEL